MYLTILCLLFPTALAAQIAAPGAELGIVAIVNDEVVTNMDVSDRLNFVVATTRLPNTPETMQRLVPQVTRQLIDEKIQLQEAARLGITVERAQIRQAVEAIASRQGRSTEELYEEMSANNVAKEVLDEQVRAQIAWQAVLARSLRGQISVSDVEVERARLSESLKLTAKGAIEVEIVSLVLPVNTPDQESDVKALAEKLVAELRAGATFEDVASQFNAGTPPTPAWVALTDMEESLANALSNAVPGTVSNPARTLDGYVIIKLLGRRGISSAQKNDSELLVKDILLRLAPYDSNSDAELSLTIAKEVARNPGSCRAETVAGLDALDGLNIEVNFVRAQFSDLHQVIQGLVANLSVGAVSEPFATPDGVRVLMLCERTDTPPQMASAEAIYAQLMNKKMELETQRYLRDLRRDAFIEFRR